MDIRKFFFDNRSYTPIPLIIAVLILAQPTWNTFLIGISISVVGELIRIRAVAHAGSATRTTSGAGGEELVMTGPYAFMRNPLYLGNFLMASGLCIAAWPWMPWMLLLLFVLFVVQYAFIISLEKNFCRITFAKFTKPTGKMCRASCLNCRLTTADRKEFLRCKKRYIRSEAR